MELGVGPEFSASVEDLTREQLLGFPIEAVRECRQKMFGNAVTNWPRFLSAMRQLINEFPEDLDNAPDYDFDGTFGQLIRDGMIPALKPLLATSPKFAKYVGQIGDSSTSTNISLTQKKE